MERYELNAENAAEARELARLEKEAHQTSGMRQGIVVNEGGVYRVDVANGVTSKISPQSSNGQDLDGVDGAGLLNTIRSGSGAPISRAPMASDTVEIAGMRTTVAVAMTMGLLRTDANGNLYEVAGSPKS